MEFLKISAVCIFAFILLMSFLDFTCCSLRYKESKKYSERQEQEIEKQWKTKWESEHVSSDHTDVSQALLFVSWMQANMVCLRNGSVYNKRMNFTMKGIALIIFPSTYVSFLWIYHKTGNIDPVMIPIVSLVPLIPSYVVCKWIGVRKYQETWSRYSSYRNRILQEMTKYIYELSPYDDWGTRKTLFIERTLDLTKENAAKFQKNMEEKENELFSFSEIADKFQKN